MTNSYSKNKQKKWDTLFKKLDDAHIAWLKKLAQQMETWDLDSKEIRANIALFKTEKFENQYINKIGESILKKRLDKIKSNKK